ncbi:MAG: RNA-binding protein, partial [Haliea sp.]
MSESTPPQPPKPAATRIRAANSAGAAPSTGSTVRLNKRMAELGICSR